MAKAGTRQVVQHMSIEHMITGSDTKSSGAAPIVCRKPSLYVSAFQLPRFAVDCRPGAVLCSPCQTKPAGDSQQPIMHAYMSTSPTSVSCRCVHCHGHTGLFAKPRYQQAHQGRPRLQHPPLCGRQAGTDGGLQRCSTSCRPACGPLPSILVSC